MHAHIHCGLMNDRKILNALAAVYF